MLRKGSAWGCPPLAREHQRDIVRKGRSALAGCCRQRSSADARLRPRCALFGPAGHPATPLASLVLAWRARRTGTNGLRPWSPGRSGALWARAALNVDALRHLRLRKRWILAIGLSVAEAPSTAEGRASVGRARIRMSCLLILFLGLNLTGLCTEEGPINGQMAP